MSPRDEITTTDAGIPASSDEFSLTVGANGPILLQDHYLWPAKVKTQTEQSASRSRQRAGR